VEGIQGETGAVSVVERVLKQIGMKHSCMVTKTWGMIVSVLGALGLIASVVMVNVDGTRHLEILFAGGILGTIAFFTGIWMVPVKAAKSS
jgi:hypothetical protein